MIAEIDMAEAGKALALMFGCIAVLGATFGSLGAMLKFFDRYKAPRVSVEAFQVMVITQAENVKRLDKHEERLSALEKEMTKAVAATTVLDKLLDTWEVKHGR